MRERQQISVRAPKEKAMLHRIAKRQDRNPSDALRLLIRSAYRAMQEEARTPVVQPQSAHITGANINQEQSPAL